ncbi:MAG: hypothetical protein AB1724_08995, partial [Thermodesulfobacteriota bacterium]
GGQRHFCLEFRAVLFPFLDHVKLLSCCESELSTLSSFWGPPQSNDVIFDRACKSLEDGHRVEDFALDNIGNLSDAFLHYFRGIEIISIKLTAKWRSENLTLIRQSQLNITNKLHLALEKLSGKKRITAIRNCSDELDRVEEDFISTSIERTLKILGITTDDISEKDIIRLRNQLSHGRGAGMELTELKQTLKCIEKLSRKVIGGYAKFVATKTKP